MAIKINIENAKNLNEVFYRTCTLDWSGYSLPAYSSSLCSR